MTTTLKESTSDQEAVVGIYNTHIEAEAQRPR